MPKMPGRGAGITTLVLGIVLMLFIAPAVFFGMMIYGVSQTGANSIHGGTTNNGDSVTVTASGDFTVQVRVDTDPACSLVDSSGAMYSLRPSADADDTYTASGVPAGPYRIYCAGLSNDSSFYAVNSTPDAVTKTFVVPFVWGSVVGVTGLICLIVGIVLLVKVNGTPTRQGRALWRQLFRPPPARGGESRVLPGLTPFLVSHNRVPQREDFVCLPCRSPALARCVTRPLTSRAASCWP